jgi:hypothetical protein
MKTQAMVKEHKRNTGKVRSHPRNLGRFGVENNPPYGWNMIVRHKDDPLQKFDSWWDGGFTLRADALDVAQTWNAMSPEELMDELGCTREEAEWVAK